MMIARFLVLLALLVPLSAQETLMRHVFDPKTDTHVEVLALFTRPSPGGYFPVRVKVANNLKTSRTITLDFESNAGWNDGNRCRSSFSITAPAGKAVTRDLVVPLAPVSPAGGDHMDLRARLSGDLGEIRGGCDSSYADNQPGVLLSETLFTPNASALDSHTATLHSGRHGGSANFAAKFDPRQLPDDWRAFSGYDSVLMTDDDWFKIPPGARNAILSWVRLGGQLVVYTSGSVTAAALGLPDDPGFGEISLVPHPSGSGLDVAATVSLVTGRSAVTRHTALNQDFDGVWPLQNAFGGQAYRYGLFIGILIVFGILVGPVNLFWLAGSGKRHMLFITTPLISLGASLILIAVIVLQDGFGGTGMRLVLMETRGDDAGHSAFIHQEQVCRSGVLTASRFTLETPCTISPVPISQNRWARYTNSHQSHGHFTLQPDGAKLLASGDWFQSRSEHGHALSAVVPTRGRIERTDATDTFFSTFEFPIERLFYQDPSNKWHRAEAIVPGGKFKLTPVDFSMVDPELSKLAADFTERNREFLKKATRRPGHFVAITRSAPGIDTLPGIRWKETRTILTGPVLSP